MHPGDELPANHPAVKAYPAAFEDQPKPKRTTTKGRTAKKVILHRDRYTSTGGTGAARAERSDHRLSRCESHGRRRVTPYEVHRGAAEVARRRLKVGRPCPVAPTRAQRPPA